MVLKLDLNLTKNFARTLVLATSLVALSMASPAMAQQATDAISLDQVVATVDGHDITQRDLTFAAEDLASDLAQIPTDQQRSFVLSVLIDLRLMAKAARALDLDKSDTFAARQTYLESRSLRRAYLSEVVTKTITEDIVREAYDASVAEFKPQEQVHARHILVATLDDAQAVLDELATGKPFEDVAREKSTGPSGPNGGELGFFGRGQMVPSFEEAAFTTEPGSVSEPVQTQFGWHLIKVEEKRNTAAPTFEETAPQLRQSLLIDAFNKVIAGLKTSADIEVLDETIQLEIVKYMSLPISPLAPESFPDLADIDGVTLYTGRGTGHYPGRPNLLLASFDEGTSIAGTFTSSKCSSATVDWCRAKLANSGSARALVVNAGNANAFTGSLGVETVEQVAQKAADLIDANPDEIYQASTGVIAEPLDPAAICQALDGIKSTKPGTFADAAQAICTTDTFKKGASATVTFDGVPVNFVGIAKGSGMIEPDMATMLSFIFTDAPIAAPLLQTLLSKAVSKSFNAITVDGDTSTSDTVLVFATGKADIAAFDSEDDPRVALIQQALSQLCLDLAHQVVRDGEGASKFVSVTVTGAQDEASAHKIAQTVANSPLVKTAIAGEDANWGRVVMAVGRAGEPANRDKLSISFGPHLLAENGQRVENYSEEAVSAYMKGEAIDIQVDVGIADGSFTMWTCDLTHGYISINADYRS